VSKVILDGKTTYLDRQGRIRRPRPSPETTEANPAPTPTVDPAEETLTVDVPLQLEADPDLFGEDGEDESEWPFQED
jgi:hypothetical protein